MATATQIVMMDMKSNTYEEMAKYIKGQAAGICKGAVSHSYIVQQLGEKPRYLLLALEERGDPRSKVPLLLIKGFALIFVKHNAFYIDVICAKGVGRALMDRILLQARLEGIRYVSLSALPDVILFYRKFGFVNTAPHETCGTVDMQRRLTKLKPNDIPEFLTYLISKGHVRKKWCLTTESCDEEGYPMTWCNPAFRS